MPRLSRRVFLEQSMLATAALAVPATLVAPARAARRRADRIRVGVIGVRGRGRAHIAGFMKSSDSEVVAICDPDEGVIDGAMGAVPEATYYRDIRKMLEDDSIDAVSIATPNHWHALAAIWALQAGKHVYVEKPLSHNPFEGAQLVAAQRKSGLVVQHGTQARSHPAVMQAIEWMQQGGIGAVKVARGLCYKRRGTIGKVDGPQAPPATLDYDLWSGPARLQPLMRKNLHYDWHWVFETGNGDIGNQGVHQMDLAAWGMQRSDLPHSVMSCGARLGYDDDGDTPNTQVTQLQWPDCTIIFEVRGLPTDAYGVPGSGAHIGTIFHGERGHLVIASYGKVVAFDLDGQPMQEFRGGSEQLHYQNFLDAVKAGDPGQVNASAEIGHLSSALCHLGNASVRLGADTRLSDTDAPFGDAVDANESFVRFRDHLVANGLDPSGTIYGKGPRLVVDRSAADARVGGEHAAAANALLTREYREPFAVRAI